MALDTVAILNAVASHAAASGHFERVNQHEPPHPPGTGLTAAVWVDRLDPGRGVSGLAATSIVLTLNLRIYASGVQEPRDAIDPAIYAATDALMVAYSGDFDLGGLVRNVDLLGAHGGGLVAQSAWQDIQGVAHRVVTITIPLVINDAFSQAP